jgi:sec-independent protein translocase protein TatC
MSRPSSYATTLYDHVRELQFRLLASVAVLIVGGVVGYFLYGPIFELLRAPLHTQLYYSSPAGSFLFVMKIALLVAVAVALPVIIYNLIMFIRPAFKEQLSRSRVYLTTLASIVLAFLGALFAFAVILPASIKFFVGFQVTGLSALLDASTYLSFVINILISFIVVFQLPLLIAFIDHIKPISPKRLLKFEKWVIIGAALVGVLAPFSFDPITELLIAAPIIILFNLSILMIVAQHAWVKHLAKVAVRKQQQTVLQSMRRIQEEPAFESLLPQAHAIVQQPTTTTSVLESSFIEELAPIEVPVREVEPVVVVATQIPHTKRWMDVAQTAPRQTTTLSPTPQRVRTEVAVPQRPRLISDMI